MNQSLHLSGNTLSIQGVTDSSEEDYLEVQIKLEQFYDDGDSTELTNWIGADGTVEDWYFDLVVDDDWVDPDESYTLIYARALNEQGEASVTDVRIVRFARMAVSISEPSLGTPLVGVVEFSGTAEGTDHDRIEYKIDNGDWVLGDSLTYQEEGVQDWSFTWDSVQVGDGSHRISVRMVNTSDVTSDVLKRTYEVDNLPAAPNFAFAGTVGVYDGGLPVNSAVAGTVLEVRFGLRNIGDLDANEVYLTLDAPGSDSTTYPSEGKVTSLEEGESVSVTLYWWATEAGLNDVTLSLDPTEQYEDPTEATTPTRSVSKSMNAPWNPCSVSWLVLLVHSQRCLFQAYPTTFNFGWTTWGKATPPTSTSPWTGWGNWVGNASVNNRSASSPAPVRRLATPLPVLPTTPRKKVLSLTVRC